MRSVAADALSVPVGTYGGQSIGAKGQSWYGNPDPWFKRIAGEAVERLFTTTSSDRVGCVQVRGYTGSWLVALTRHFEARGQTTWRVARLARDELASWLPALALALREPAADEAFAARDRLTLRLDLAGLRGLRRRALPWLQGLDAWSRSDRPPSPQPVLGFAGLAGSDRETTSATDAFACLLVCAARLAELDGQVRNAPRDGYGIAVMPEPLAEREHGGFLNGRWAAILSPGVPDRVRGAEPMTLEPKEQAVRGVALARLANLPDGEFDDLLWYPARTNPGWIVPARLIPVRLRTSEDWEKELLALAGSNDVEKVRRRVLALGAAIMGRPGAPTAEHWELLAALAAIEERACASGREGRRRSPPKEGDSNTPQADAREGVRDRFVAEFLPSRDRDDLEAALGE